MSRENCGQEKESQILSSICDYLSLGHHCFWRANNMPTFSRNTDGSVRMHALPKYTPRGLPDINLIFKGVYWGLEVKSANGIQRPEQKDMEKWIRLNGGCYHIVRSIDDCIKLGL